MNSSFTLDGSPPWWFVHPWDVQCWSDGGLLGCYNTSVYSTGQSLTDGVHTLIITMFSYSGPNFYGGGTSGYNDFWFDYAVIYAPISPSQQPHNKFILPAAIGGTVGGIAAVIAITLAVLYYRKRGYERQQPHAEVDPEPTQSSFQPTMFVTNPPLNRDTSYDWSPSSLLPGDTSLQNNDILPPPVPPKSGIPSPTVHVPSPLVAVTEQGRHSSLGPSPQHAETATVARTYANSGSMPVGTSPITNTRLTEDQSELVQSLIRYNVPLVTVAGVMEGLLRREGPSGDSEGPGSHVAQNDVCLEAENPPDYDFV